MKTDSLDGPAVPHVFFPAFQVIGHQMNVYARTAASAEGLQDPIRRVVQAVDPSLPVSGIRALETIVAASLAPRRFAAQLLALFAALALGLAALGIYGVMGYQVRQRKREIGVRIALGAGRADVLRLVLGRGLALTACGIAAGALASASVVRSLSSLVFGVAPFDPVAFLGGTGLLVLVATAACCLPARRAMAVDPVVALRSE
jgi:ABC-type antimicrobial peptide transport system permease subunit